MERRTAPSRPSDPHEEGRAAGPLGELALLFLRLGATAFGGPAAHIAMMQDEVVRRRRWMSPEQFIDLLGATNLIPGPNSTELAIHIGHSRGGWKGLLVAGSAFIFPAVVITGALAWVYVRFGSLPEVAWILYGVKPVVIAVVAQAIALLAPKAIRRPHQWAFAAAAASAAAAGCNEFVVLLGTGAASIAVAAAPRRPQHTGALVLPSLALAAGTPAGVRQIESISVLWVFVKIGSVLFGSGYVLLAFLRAELVDRLGWLNESQLIDAVAIGQVTPGPVFTTATFVGYLVGGTTGAAAATIGIFLPAFVFVALSIPLLARLRSSWVASAFLDGVNVASVVLMALVTFQLGRAAIVDVPTTLLSLGSLALLLRGVNSSWLISGGCIVGWVLRA